MAFSPDVERALRVACAAHAKQFRKDGRTPYFLHPVHVALILARWGADAVTLQAGILHDVVEDCAEWTAERLREEFGASVADVVADVTEDKSIARPPPSSASFCFGARRRRMSGRRSTGDGREHCVSRGSSWPPLRCA